jgi:hypothetical protein
MITTPARQHSFTMSTVAALLLLCFLSASCMSERQGGTAATDFERVAGEAVQAMQRRAVEMSAIGAGMVAYVPGDTTIGWSSRMVVVGNFIKDDTNLLAVVYTKAAEMADTLKDSGSGVRPKKKHENGWKGGVIRKVSGGYVLAAFSGASSEDDVLISQAGVEVLIRSFDAKATSK